MRRRDQLFRAGGAAGVESRSFRKVDVVRADLAAGELDLAGPFLQGALPGNACCTYGHLAPLPRRRKTSQGRSAGTTQLRSSTWVDQRATGSAAAITACRAATCPSKACRPV